MTNLYFVRHAQPDGKWADERTRPLTAQGAADSERLADVLAPLGIGAVYASPYVRSFDTVAPLARRLGLPIRTDERLRERMSGPDSHACLERRWQDFDFAEQGGETMRHLQRRNMQAVHEILCACGGKNVVVGSHGMALSAVLNAVDPEFGCDGFLRLYNLLPYCVRLTYDGLRFCGREDVFSIDRGY